MKPAKPKPSAPNTTSDGQLACAFGEPWLGPHYLCQAWTEATTGQPAILPDFSRYAPKRLGPKPDAPALGQGVLFAAEDR